MHRFLTDPDNAAAFAHLTAVPIGTVRTWAKALGWSGGKMQRFLKAIVRYELAEIEVQHRRSVFRPRVNSSVSHRIVSHRPPNNQGPCSGLTAPRFRQRTAKPQSETPGAELLVQAMNESLKRFDSYLPVRADNFSSHRAAHRWLAEKDIPLEEAIALLHRKAEAFSLDLSPDGKYPFSIAYFSRAVLAEWRRILRDRQQLGLFPKLDMHVERSSTEQPPAAQQNEPASASPEQRRWDPVVVAEVMARLAAEKDLKDDDQDYVSPKPTRL